ncbi:AraC family transcriptional regulator [Catalinimonas niigatensis]|uniref:AraC family transcriptional regulator n=1 Tax=Catalinimonas niigatensis TaxID=1397264 RepID=UPI0026660388|nr:AraC family transcriptional regulator [Catalinimonas niigatensis]WPP50958.1 AraC family transcriptional regulator [Catalinimonas niigatensis]
MKPILEKLLPQPDASFSVSAKGQPLFDPFLHKHDMFELTYMPRIKAQRFIGDNVREIDDSELVLLAPNLIHCWHILRAEEQTISALVIHFSEDFMGSDFFKKPELSGFQKLMKLAQRGIKFNGKLVKDIVSLMQDMRAEPPIRRFITLLRIFEIMADASSDNYEMIASANYKTLRDEKEYKKINQIYGYVQQNYMENISLQTAADIANLSPSAFCRYFKKCTHKTFIEFVKEVRISRACHMLRDQHISIAEVGYACGYNNMANFNRQFRQVTQKNPRTYQRLFSFEANGTRKF